MKYEDNKEILLKNIRHYELINRYIKLFGTIIVLLLVIYLIHIYFFKYKIYTLNGESDSFYYKDGVFISDADKYIFIHGDIISKSDEIKTDDIVSYSLKCDNHLVISSHVIPTGVSMEDKGYNELFPTQIINNIDKCHIGILYLYDNRLIEEKIKLHKSNIYIPYEYRLIKKVYFTT